MQHDGEPSSVTVLGRGALAGLAGTVVMTAFEELVEMPLTRRQVSCAPADFAEEVLPVHPTTAAGRRRLNDTTHLSLGAMWGTAYGLAAARGLRRQKAVHTVSAVVHTGDVFDRVLDPTRA